MLPVRTLLAAALLATACGATSSPASDVAVVDVVAYDAARHDVAGPDGAADSLSAEDLGGDAAAGPDASADAFAVDAIVAPDAARAFPAALPARVPLDGQLLLAAHLDARPEPSWLVVDTGAVRTALDEELLRNVANGVGIATLDLGGGLVLPDYEVLAAALGEAEAHIGIPLDGLIGQDLFLRYWFGLDYRGPHAYVAAVAPEGPPPGFEGVPRLDVPYELVQGLPIVEVRIGDQTARLIADTGSGVTILRSSRLPAALREGGLGGYVWYTSYGSDPGVIVRVPEMALGDAVVGGAWAVAIPDEHHLSALFSMIGVEVDGFLGYPVYRRFFVGVNGPAGRYELYADPEGDPVPRSEWNRVGIELSRDDVGVVVDMVFTPSDAATEGLAPGDRLLAIDGTPVGDARLDDLRTRLRGTPGDVRLLTVGSGDEPARDVSVQVDALL